MTARSVCLTAVLLLGLALPAAAQQPSVNVDKLPVDLARIQRQLRQQATVREEHNGLNLEYYVDVFGRAPRIELFPPMPNLFTAPPVYGAPTHRDMIQAITPQEHRAPAADLGSLFKWGSDKARDRRKNR